MKKILTFLLGAVALTSCAQTPISSLPQMQGFDVGDSLVNYALVESNRLAYRENVSDFFPEIGLDINHLFISCVPTNGMGGLYTWDGNFGRNANGSLIASVIYPDGTVITSVQDSNATVQIQTAGRVIGIWSTNFLGSPFVVTYPKVSDFSSTGNAANWILKNIPASSISQTNAQFDFLYPAPAGNASVLGSIPCGYNFSINDAGHFEAWEIPRSKLIGTNITVVWTLDSATNTEWIWRNNFYTNASSVADLMISTLLPADDVTFLAHQATYETNSFTILSTNTDLWIRFGGNGVATNQTPINLRYGRVFIH